MTNRYDRNPFDEEDEVNPFSNAGSVPSAANSRLSPLPHEPVDFYDGSAPVDIHLDSAGDSKKKERELQARETQLKRREQALKNKERELQARETELKKREQDLKKKERELQARETEFKRRELNAGSVPYIANSRLSPLPHEPDFYDRSAPVDIPLDSAGILKKKERELQARETALKRRDQDPAAVGGRGSGKSNFGRGAFYTTNAGSVPSAANSRLSPLPHEPVDFYDRSAPVDIPFDSAGNLKKKERELQARETKLKRRESEENVDNSSRFGPLGPGPQEDISEVAHFFDLPFDPDDFNIDIDELDYVDEPIVVGETGEKSSSSPLVAAASQRDGVPEWLPQGWTKVFIAPESERMFFSKQQVLDYLKTLNSTPAGDEIPTVVCETRDKSSLGPDEDQIDEVPEWLPQGWTMQMKIMESGQTEGKRSKCFIAPDGRECYSKRQVFDYLKTIKNRPAGEKRTNHQLNGGECSLEPVESEDCKSISTRPSISKQKKAADSLSSKDYKVIQSTPVVGLPPGWIKERRQKQLRDGGLRTDPYFIHPSCEYEFRSKPDAERYLYTGKIKECKSWPKRRAPNKTATVPLVPGQSLKRLHGAEYEKKSDPLFSERAVRSAVRGNPKQLEAEPKTLSPGKESADKPNVENNEGGIPGEENLVTHRCS